MWPWGDPRRLAYIKADVASFAGNYCFAGLYNNSTGQHILCVWAVIQYAASAVTISTFSVQPGLLGTVGVSGVPAFYSQQQPPGQETAYYNATIPSPFQYLGSTLLPQANPLPFPFAFVPPNCTFIVNTTAVGTQMNVSIFYEWRWAWEFPVIPQDPHDLPQ